MKSSTSRQFREMYANLPTDVRKRARAAYKLFQSDPSHRSLNFKQVIEQRRIYSARVGLNYRALGRLSGEDIVWFWIGTHAEYDKLL